MKSVYLLRHGKSDWNVASGEDHDRPINARGREASRRMGLFLADAGQLPDHVVSSTAVRARMTLEEARAGGAWSRVETAFSDDLYEASPEAVLEVVRAAPSAAGRLLLVGHEPTWSDTVRRLVADGPLRLKFPTAAVARVDLEVDAWEAASFGRGILKWLVVPKLLR